MLTRHSCRGTDHGSRTHPGLKRNSSAHQWRACSTGSAISPSAAANGEQTEMIRANLRGALICHFALQSADASEVSVGNNKETKPWLGVTNPPPAERHASTIINFTTGVAVASLA